jgi:hypothetical protein
VPVSGTDKRTDHGEPEDVSDRMRESGEMHGGGERLVARRYTVACGSGGTERPRRSRVATNRIGHNAKDFWVSGAREGSPRKEALPILPSPQRHARESELEQWRNHAETRVKLEPDGSQRPTGLPVRCRPATRPCISSDSNLTVVADFPSQEPEGGARLAESRVPASSIERVPCGAVNPVVPSIVSVAVHRGPDMGGIGARDCIGIARERGAGSSDARRRSALRSPFHHLALCRWGHHLGESRGRHPHLIQSDGGEFDRGWRDQRVRSDKR